MARPMPAGELAEWAERWLGGHHPVQAEAAMRLH